MKRDITNINNVCSCSLNPFLLDRSHKQLFFCNLLYTLHILAVEKVRYPRLKSTQVIHLLQHFTETVILRITINGVKSAIPSNQTKNKPDTLVKMLEGMFSFYSF